MRLLPLVPDGCSLTADFAAQDQRAASLRGSALEAVDAIADLFAEAA